MLRFTQAGRDATDRIAKVRELHILPEDILTLVTPYVLVFSIPFVPSQLACEFYGVASALPPYKKYDESDDESDDESEDENKDNDNENKDDKTPITMTYQSAKGVLKTLFARPNFRDWFFEVLFEWVKGRPNQTHSTEHDAVYTIIAEDATDEKKRQLMVGIRGNPTFPLEHQHIEMYPDGDLDEYASYERFCYKYDDTQADFLCRSKVLRSLLWRCPATHSLFNYSFENVLFGVKGRFSDEPNDLRTSLLFKHDANSKKKMAITCALETLLPLNAGALCREYDVS